MSQQMERDDLDQGLETVRLPLFPLRLVLFPGQVLPLHIFEPRYRLMINHCIDEREPFGVVLMREEALDWRRYKGDVALPHDVGTTAHIRQVERLPDGRLNIITVGLHRFRVRQLHFDLPYLQGEVEIFPLARPSEPGVTDDADAVRRLVTSYVGLLSKVMDAEIDIDELPEDPRTLAYLAASALQIPWDDKQALLTIPELPRLLAAERQLLRMEHMMLRFMQATEGRIADQVMGSMGYIYPN
jgi:Lon protease-like protein